MLWGISVNTWIQIVTVGLLCPILLVGLAKQYEKLIDKILVENKERENKWNQVNQSLMDRINEQQTEWLDRLSKNEGVMQQFLDGLKIVTDTQKEIQNTQKDMQTSILFVQKDVEELRSRV